MSNITKTIDYLKASPTNRFIRIINSGTNVKLGKTDIYLDNIPAEDLTAYIKTNLGPIAVPTSVYVEVRIKDGATSRKKDGYSIEIQPEIVPVPLPTLPVPAAPVSYPAVVQPTQPDFLGTGGLGQTLGLGFGDVLTMHHNSSRLKDKEEQLAELKDEHKELKQENRLLEIDNRELKTKLSMSEAKEQMAVMMVKSENKSFYDSPAFEKIMEQAPQILAGIAAMKGGAVAAGALGSPDLSETHNSLIDYIASNLDEQQANYIGSICGKMTNPNFMAELKALITRYGTN
jgi:regulator of replication initiation timing